MKTNEKSNIPELVQAAQIAGAEDSQEFWRQVTAHTQQREHSRAALVTPRRLTDVPKYHTT